MAIFFQCLFADLTVAVVTLGILVYWYFTKDFDYWKKHNAPFLKPIPVFGNFKDRLLFRKSNCHVSRDLYNQMEGHKVFGVWMLNQPMLFIRDPEIVKRILVKDFANFHDRGMTVDEKRNPLSAHLFNLGGQRWRALRLKLTPTFTSGKMKMMFSLMQECAREFGDFVEKEAWTSGEVEFKEILAKFTTDVIGTCAFGLQCNSMKDPDSEFRAMGRKVFEPSLLGTLGLLLFNIVPFIGKLLNLRFPKKDVSDFFMKVVEDTVEYREKNNIRRNDFLQLLIDLKNKGKLEDDDRESKTVIGDNQSVGDTGDVELTNNLLAAQAFVFFLAGFETSSTAMSFALHELTANPEVLAKLREEIDTVLKESGGEITYDALRKMVYLENVINESLRKYPPVPMLMRVCNKRYVEPDTGAVIEENIRVQIPVYALQNDPKYFPNPEKFDPDRFTEEEKAKRPHYVYLPFGEGPRICIGLRFGMLQAKLGLATLLSRFDVSASPRTPHPLKLLPQALVTTCEGGVWAKVAPRKAWVNSTTDSYHHEGIITTEL